MKIFLCGFMGAGKTHLMKKLQTECGQKWDFIDLDDWLFERLKTPQDGHLGDCIQHLGWNKFRAMEKSSILEILTWKKNVCVSLGGGALNQDTLSAIKQNVGTLLIWVNTPIEICLKRIRGDLVRPLAKKSDQELNALYLERLPFYQQSHIQADDIDQSMNDLEAFVRKHVGSA